MYTKVATIAWPGIQLIFYNTPTHKHANQDQSHLAHKERHGEAARLEDGQHFGYDRDVGIQHKVGLEAHPRTFNLRGHVDREIFVTLQA